MSDALARELIATLAEQLDADPVLAERLADALKPHLGNLGGGGWLAPKDAVA